MAAEAYLGHSDLSASKAAAEEPDSICPADRATYKNPPNLITDANDEAV